MQEPRGPRPVCDLFLEHLAAAQAQVAQLTEDGQSSGERSAPGAGPGPGPGRQPGPATPASPTFATGAGDVLQRNVAALFRERVSLLEEVHLTQASLMAAILRTGLKSLLEAVRLATLARAGLQQLQVDVQYLRPRLRKFCSGQEIAVVQHLLDDVLTAAIERSLEPHLLDPDLVAKILAP